MIFGFKSEAYSNKECSRMLSMLRDGSKALTGTIPFAGTNGVGTAGPAGAVEVVSGEF